MDKANIIRKALKPTPLMIAVVAFDSIVGYLEREEEQRQSYITDTSASIRNGIVALGAAHIFHALYQPIFSFVESHTTSRRKDMTKLKNWAQLFILADLTIYWYHRLAHSSSILWAAHHVHHSSDTLNAAVAFRRKWNQSVEKLSWVPLIAAGYPVGAVFAAQSYHLLYGVFCHTDRIGKLWPWYESIFVTPSHHRVHHGSQKEYLDKNFGNWLIIWDKLFGTFREEHAIPKYGTTDYVNPSSVWKQQTTPLVRVLKKARRQPSFYDKARVIFKAP